MEQPINNLPLNSVIIQGVTVSQLEDMIKRAIAETQPAPVPQVISQEQDKEKFLTKKEAAKYLRISVTTLDSYRKIPGLIKTSKVGKRILFALSDLEEAVKQIK